ncbi:enoyl-CoA hydratase [Psychrobacter piechaudii]|uniref:Enoyl-CoA hydratase domain-containing protein 3, mitochondrial n=1 Tax=Psychrobacter piechaudii TaxID=1945521 RepID=A0A1R4GGM4_9GAMM|nr:enoyl-CoA hydratase [Psychrobacter piechaudii]SJM67082.1 2,3-dehydroadipyl-CoA hydratase [Psychrobacter piechaudii]
MTQQTATNTSVATQPDPLVIRQDSSDNSGVVTLTLNNPKQFNALSVALLTALQKELDEIKKDNSILVVVIAAEGKAFCAGHNLKEMRAHSEREFHQALFNQCSQMMLTLNRMPQVVIAKVQGIATAAGCQLVASCDLAVASRTAKFATSGINVGLFCSTPAVAVSRNLSPKLAFEMLITGEFIDAETAAAQGLINRVAEPEQLDNELQALIQAIISKSPVATATGKQMFYNQLSMSLPDAYDYASQVMVDNMMADDVAEGIDAFVEKRQAVWQGH